MALKSQELLEELKKYPFFSVNTLVRLTGKNPEYIKLLIHRWKSQKLILNIERDKYTMHEDPLIFSTQLVWPAYLSGWQALRYYNLTEQLPLVLDIMTLKKRKKNKIKFKEYTIRFHSINKKQFFAYNKENYKGFELFIAEPEKAILDSAAYKLISFSEISDIVKNKIDSIKKKSLIRYLINFKNKTLIKRMGFLLYNIGFDYFQKFRKYIDKNFIRLDYLLPAKGKRESRWRIIINT